MSTSLGQERGRVHNAWVWDQHRRSREYRTFLHASEDHAYHGSDTLSAVVQGDQGDLRLPRRRPQARYAQDLERYSYRDPSGPEDHWRWKQGEEGEGRADLGQGPVWQR